MATWGPIQLRLKGSRQVEFDGEASPAPGGGSTPLQPRGILVPQPPNYEVVLIDAMGLKLVTAPGVECSAPVWNRQNYKQFGFQSFLAPNYNGQLNVQDDVDDPTSARVIVPEGVLALFGLGDFARSGDWLSYTRWNADFSGNSIRVVQPDGSGDAEAIPADDMHYLGIFSPDASQLAYVNRKTANLGVYVANRDGSSPTLIVPAASLGLDTPGTEVAADVFAWTQWNRIIITWPDLSGNYQIWECDPDGGDLVQLSSFTDAGTTAQCVAPLGLGFIGQHDDGGNLRLISMPGSGTDKTVLTNATDWGTPSYG